MKPIYRRHRSSTQEEPRPLLSFFFVTLLDWCFLLWGPGADDMWAMP